MPEGRWVLKVDAGREVAIVSAKKVRAVKVSEEVKSGGLYIIGKHGVKVNYEMPYGERVPLKLCTE